MVASVALSHADGTGAITALHVWAGVADIPVLLLEVL